MTDEPRADAGTGPEPAGEEQAPTADAVDVEAVRKRAYELSQEHPQATAEENWLRAEAEVRAAADGRDHDAEARAAEEEAILRAKIDMNVYGHP